MTHSNIYAEIFHRYLAGISTMIIFLTINTIAIAQTDQQTTDPTLSEGNATEVNEGEQGTEAEDDDTGENPGNEDEVQAVPEIEISFVNNTSKVKEKYGEGLVVHNVPIRVSSEDHIPGNVLINVLVHAKSDSLTDEEFRILTPTLILTEKAENEVLGEHTLEIQIQINNDIAEEELETLDIALSVTQQDSFQTKFNNKYHTIEILDGKIPFDKNNPFRIYAGTNFDFFNGAKIDDIYGSAEVFLPNSFGKNNEYGLIAGVSQSQTLSFDSLTIEGITREYADQIITEDVDTVNLTTQRFDRSSRVSVQNTELHINVFRSIFDASNLKVHFGLQGMTVWRSYIYDYEYTNQFSETVEVAVNDISSNIGTRPLPTPARRVRNYSDTYAGLCFPITYSSQYGELFIQQGIGCLWIDEGKQIPYLNWKFRITENKLGLTFGGEIFSVIRGKNAEVRAGSNRLDTLYNIYIAKVFDLSNLTGYREKL